MTCNYFINQSSREYFILANGQELDRDLEIGLLDVTLSKLNTLGLKSTLGKEGWVSIEKYRRRLKVELQGIQNLDELNGVKNRVELELHKMEVARMRKHLDVETKRSKSGGFYGVTTVAKNIIIDDITDLITELRNTHTSSSTSTVVSVDVIQLWETRRTNIENGNLNPHDIMDFLENSWMDIEYRFRFQTIHDEFRKINISSFKENVRVEITQVGSKLRELENVSNFTNANVQSEIDSLQITVRSFTNMTGERGAMDAEFIRRRREADLQQIEQLIPNIKSEQGKTTVMKDLNGLKQRLRENYGMEFFDDQVTELLKRARSRTKTKKEIAKNFTQKVMQVREPSEIISSLFSLTDDVKRAKRYNEKISLFQKRLHEKYKMDTFKEDADRFKNYITQYKLNKQTQNAGSSVEEVRQGDNIFSSEELLSDADMLIKFAEDEFEYVLPLRKILKILKRRMECNDIFSGYMIDINLHQKKNDISVAESRRNVVQELMNSEDTTLRKQTLFRDLKVAENKLSHARTAFSSLMSKMLELNSVLSNKLDHTHLFFTKYKNALEQNLRVAMKKKYLSRLLMSELRNISEQEVPKSKKNKIIITKLNKMQSRATNESKVLLHQILSFMRVYYEERTERNKIIRKLNEVKMQLQDDV